MKFKTNEEVDALVEYVRWFGMFKNKEEATTWLDENLPRWRLVNKHTQR